MTSRDISDDDWPRILDQLESPAAGRVAEALSEARKLDVGEAYDLLAGARVVL
jgi:hypothetical protein